MKINYTMSITKGAKTLFYAEGTNFRNTREKLLTAIKSLHLELWYNDEGDLTSDEKLPKADLIRYLRDGFRAGDLSFYQWDAFPLAIGRINSTDRKAVHVSMWVDEE